MHVRLWPRRVPAGTALSEKKLKRSVSHNWIRRESLMEGPPNWTTLWAHLAFVSKSDLQQQQYRLDCNKLVNKFIYLKKMLGLCPHLNFPIKKLIRISANVLTQKLNKQVDYFPTNTRVREYKFSPSQLQTRYIYTESQPNTHFSCSAGQKHTIAEIRVLLCTITGFLSKAK